MRRFARAFGALSHAPGRLRGRPRIGRAALTAVLLGIAVGGAYRRYELARVLGDRLIEYGDQMTVAHMEAGKGFLAALEGHPDGLRRALGGYRRSGYALLIALSEVAAPRVGLPHPVVLTQIVCAAAASVVLGLWAARRIGALAGAFLAAGIAWWPPFVLHTLPAMPEALLIPIWCTLVVLHDRAFTRLTPWRFAVYGGAAGIAAQVRPELLLLPGYVALCALAIDSPWRRRATAFVALSVAFALPMAAEIGAIGIATGRWTLLPTEGGFTVWQGFGEVYNAAGVWVADTEVVEWLRTWGATHTSPEGLAFLQQDHHAHMREYPLTFALGVADRALKVLIHPYIPITLDPGGRFRSILTSGPLFLLAVAGVAWLLAPVGKGLRWTVGLPLAYTMLALGVSHYEPRYAVGATLTLFLVVAVALSRVAAPLLRALPPVLAAWWRNRHLPAALRQFGLRGHFGSYLARSRRTVFPRLAVVAALLGLFLFAVGARAALVHQARTHIQRVRIAHPSRMAPLQVWEPLGGTCSTEGSSLPADCPFTRDRFGMAGPLLRTASFHLAPGAYALLLRLRVVDGAAAMSVYAQSANGEVHTIHTLHFSEPGTWTAYAPIVVRGARTFRLEFYPMYFGQPYLVRKADLRWRNVLFLLGDRGGQPPAPPAELLSGPQHIRLEQAWIVAQDFSPLVPVAILEEPGKPLPMWQAPAPEETGETAGRVTTGVCAYSGRGLG